MMQRHPFSYALWLAAAAAAAWAIGPLSGPRALPARVQQVTHAPQGPFHVEGRAIVNAHGDPFLMRGTQLVPFDPRTVAHDNRAEPDYGGHSGTTLSAIRLRYNFNTVRLPVDPSEAGAPGYFDQLAAVVRRANEMEMLVILADVEGAPREQSRSFWRACAAYFRDWPNVIFEPAPAAAPAAPLEAHSEQGWRSWRESATELVATIRSAGAEQLVVVNSWRDPWLFAGLEAELMLRDPNVIYQVSPRYVSTHDDEARDSQFGFLAKRAPVVASGWDLDLGDPEACAAIPSDPSAATQLVQDNLDYFDRNGISWTVSVFEPGKLVTDFSEHDGTRIDYGWQCGKTGRLGPAGIGRMIQAYMRAADEQGLSVVGASGGMVIGRGGFGIAYGPIMAERDARARDLMGDVTLGGLALDVTDSKGFTRPVRMQYAAAGWGQLNFALPEEAVAGPAVLHLRRDDGSSIDANITIAETEPGFFTNYSCRGAARGEAVQTFDDGHSVRSQLTDCSGPVCRATAIPMTADSTTLLRLEASGLRHAESVEDFEVTIAGEHVRVVSFEKDEEALGGRDFLTVEAPASLRGIGETDMLCRLNGRISNVVRVNLGS
jgi:uncharacterized protein (TIGR03437 family)